MVKKMLYSFTYQKDLALILEGFQCDFPGLWYFRTHLFLFSCQIKWSKREQARMSGKHVWSFKCTNWSQLLCAVLPHNICVIQVNSLWVVKPKIHSLQITIVAYISLRLCNSIHVKFVWHMWNWYDSVYNI